jgi:hypothetical protein
MNQVCEAVGCNRRADRNMAGRYICDECYLANKPIFFGWPEPSMRRSFWETHPRVAAIVMFIFITYIIGGAAAGLWAMWPHVKCDSFPRCLLD